MRSPWRQPANVRSRSTSGHIRTDNELALWVDSGPRWLMITHAGAIQILATTWSRPSSCAARSDAHPGHARGSIDQPAFIGNLQAALGEEFLDVAVAQCEPEIKPNRVLDDRRREAMPSVGELIHAGSLPHGAGPPRTPFP